MANGQFDIIILSMTRKETLNSFTKKLHVVNFMNDFSEMYVNSLPHVTSMFIMN